MKERNRRSIVKALTWRFSATIATIILVYAITRNLRVSFGIGFIEVFLKLFLYYLHERIWDNIGWGRKVEENSTPRPIGHPSSRFLRDKQEGN